MFNKIRLRLSKDQAAKLEEYLRQAIASDSLTGLIETDPEVSAVVALLQKKLA